MYQGSFIYLCNSLSHIIFDDPSHTYTNRASGEVYKSATQIIGLYKQPFDGAYWSLYKALERFLLQNDLESVWKSLLVTIRMSEKNERYLLDIIRKAIPDYLVYILFLREQILAEWEGKKNKACAKGTAYHKFREDQAYVVGSQQLTSTLR